jgi:hypothetical protein
VTDIPKPNRTAFMLAGYDLADALAILEKWESLTEAQIQELGLSLGTAPEPRRDLLQ